MRCSPGVSASSTARKLVLLGIPLNVIVATAGLFCGWDVHQQVPRALRRIVVDLHSIEPHCGEQHPALAHGAVSGVLSPPTKKSLSSVRCSGRIPEMHFGGTDSQTHTTCSCVRFGIICLHAHLIGARRKRAGVECARSIQWSERDPSPGRRLVTI